MLRRGMGLGAKLLIPDPGASPTESGLGTAPRPPGADATVERREQQERRLSLIPDLVSNWSRSPASIFTLFSTIKGLEY